MPKNMGGGGRRLKSTWIFCTFLAMWVRVCPPAVGFSGFGGLTASDLSLAISLGAGDWQVRQRRSRVQADSAAHVLREALSTQTISTITHWIVLQPIA